MKYRGGVKLTARKGSNPGENKALTRHFLQHEAHASYTLPALCFRSCFRPQLTVLVNPSAYHACWKRLIKVFHEIQALSLKLDSIPDTQACNWIVHATESLCLLPRRQGCSLRHCWLRRDLCVPGTVSGASLSPKLRKVTLRFTASTLVANPTA